MLSPTCWKVASTLTRATTAIAALACAAPALAQSQPATAYYGALTASEQTQIQAWGIAYWNKVESGTVTTLTFSNPDMNSHLFNPFHGPRATLEKLKLLDARDCTKAIIESEAADRPAAMNAKRQALKDALTAAKFTTDMVSNSAGTAAHVVKILDASTTSELVTYQEGGKLTSEKLPLDVLMAAGANPELAATLKPSSADIINALVVACPGYAMNSTGVTEAQKLLTGGVSRADDVASRVRTLLHDVQYAGAEVEQLEATFGTYGSLPIVYVALTDCGILIDGITGNIAGPYKLRSEIDAEPLLAAHSAEYAGTGSVVYTAAAGCSAPVMAVWNPTPPPGTNPWDWGLWPWPRPMGQPTGWTCTQLGTVCSCTQDHRVWLPTIPPGYDPKYPTRTTIRTTCTIPGTCPAMTFPPRIGSPSLGGWGCSDQYWY